MTDVDPGLTYDEAVAAGLIDDGPDDQTVVEMVPPAKRTSWSADELMRIEFPAQRWAVPGVLAQGLNLLAGPPKVGKSWLALGLGVAVASGGMAFGSIDVEQGEVLYLALEDNGRRLQRRLRALLGGDTAPSRLRLATVCEPLAEGGAFRISDWLERTPDARLVVVDVFGRVRGRTSERANQYESDYAAMSIVKNIADEHDVAILVVHHTRKASSDDFLDSVSGTHGLAGAADAVLVLRRSRGSAGAVLHITGRDVEEAEHALDFDSATGTWKLLGGPAADYEIAPTRRRVLQHVREHGPSTPQQIANGTGIAHATVRQTCKRMADDGQLDAAAGVYTEPLSPVTAVTLSLESDVVT